MFVKVGTGSVVKKAVFNGSLSFGKRLPIGEMVREATKNVLAFVVTNAGKRMVDEERKKACEMVCLEGAFGRFMDGV